jgi:hypothetical protein
MRDLNYVLYTGSRSQRFNLHSAATIAHGADHGAFRALNYMRLIAAFFDSFNHVIDFFRGS